MHFRETAQLGLIQQGHAYDLCVGWERSVLEQLKSRLEGDSDFPCVFAKNAFKKVALRFLFVPDDTEGSVRDLAEGLEQYVELSRSWDGTVDTAYPLIIAYSKEAISSEELSAYQNFGWAILQRLHHLDKVEWPSDIARDADSPSWSMCFAGMPLFFNMSAPVHTRRKSRNLGDYFIMVVNPRERFDDVAGNTRKGSKIREKIRNRIEAYDGIPHAPQLSSYSTGGLEWWQYSLHDGNEIRQDRCPFRSSSTES